MMISKDNSLFHNKNVNIINTPNVYKLMCHKGENNCYIKMYHDLNFF